MDIISIFKKNFLLWRNLNSSCHEFLASLNLVNNEIYQF